MKQKGFTLLELLVTIILLGILAAFAAPNYRNMIANSKIRDFSERWQTSYYYAQKEALRRREKVQICGSSDGKTCNEGQNFSKGWLVFIYNGGSGGQYEILQDVAYDDPSVTASFNISPRCSPGVLCFLHNGRLAGNFRGGSLTVSADASKNQTVSKKLVISAAGRIRVENKTETNG